VIAERYARGETMATLASQFSVGKATVWRPTIRRTIRDCPAQARALRDQIGDVVTPADMKNNLPTLAVHLIAGISVPVLLVYSVKAFPANTVESVAPLIIIGGMALIVWLRHLQD
jgi:hypothetical protein